MPLSPKDEEFLLQVIAGSESSGRDYDKNGKMIKNPESSARFRYQIVKDTFNGAVRNIQKDINYRRPGYTFSFDSPQDHEYVARYLVKKEYPAILKRAGFKDEELTVSHFYALHFKGDVSYVKKAFREPNTPLSKVMNSEEISKNGFKPNQTLGDSIQFLNNGLLKRNNTKMLLFDPKSGNRGVFQGGGKFQFSGTNSNNSSNNKNTQVSNSNHNHNHNHNNNTGNKFHSGETHRITSFHNALKKEFPGIKITNTKRDSTASYGSKGSRHHHGDAIDLGYTPELERFLKSERGAKLLQEHGLGMLLEVPNNEYNHSQPWDVSPLKRYEVNGKVLRKGTNGTGKHIHLGPDIYKNNGNMPFDPKGPNNVYNQYVQKNGITSRYSSDNTYSSGKNPGNIIINQNNTKMSYTLPSLSEERKKELGLDKVQQAGSKLNAKSKETQNALSIYDNALKNAKDAMEGHLIGREFQNKGWFVTESRNGISYGGGVLNDALAERERGNMKKRYDSIKSWIKSLEEANIEKKDGIITKITFEKLDGKDYAFFGQKPTTKYEDNGATTANTANSNRLKKHKYVFEGEELDKLKNAINLKIEDLIGQKYDIDTQYVKNTDWIKLAEPNGYMNAEMSDKIINDVRVIPPSDDELTRMSGIDTSQYGGGDGDGTGSQFGGDGGFGLNGDPLKADVHLIQWNNISAKDLSQYKLKDLFKYKEITPDEMKLAKQIGFHLNNNNLQAFREQLKEKVEQAQKDVHKDNVYNQDTILYQAEQSIENQFKYDPSKSDWKSQAFDLLGGLTNSFLGITKGNELSKTPIEERDEFIGESFMDYTKELKKLSEIGLKPEEEAYAKRMLAESYQSRLDNIVRSSGGNRNVVLGNLGRLDYQKQLGLMNLALEDAKQKREALHKYGEATKYISEFENRKQIENNERKFKLAMLNKEIGGKLAQEGFKNLVTSINEFKDKAPGSVYDMQKYFIQKKMFGYGNEEERQQYEIKMRKLEEDTAKGRVVQDYVKSLSPEKQMEFYNTLSEKGININQIDRIKNAGIIPEFFENEEVKTENETGKKSNAHDPFTLYKNTNDNGNLSVLSPSTFKLGLNKVEESLPTNNTAKSESDKVVESLIPNRIKNPYENNISLLENKDKIDDMIHKTGNNVLPPKKLNIDDLSLTPKVASEYESLVQKQRNENEILRNNANNFLLEQESRVEDILKSQQEIDDEMKRKRDSLVANYNIY